jgi:hypothetical protein
MIHQLRIDLGEEPDYRLYLNEFRVNLEAKIIQATRRSAT